MSAEADLDTLERLAREANTGAASPWHVEHGSVHIIRDAEGCEVGMALLSQHAALMAACHPAAVLELVARVRELEAEVAENDGVLAVWRRRTLDAEAECQRLRERLAELGGLAALKAIPFDNSNFHQGYATGWDAAMLRVLARTGAPSPSAEPLAAEPDKEEP
jgi:hypothetical protein